MIAEKLLELVRMHASKKQSSENNPKLLGSVCYGRNFGLATLLVSDQFCTHERSWILFGTTLVLAVCVPDSS